MLQKENVEIEHQHNYRGTAPAVFREVSDIQLRHHNRGAVLANIFERYTSSTPQGNKQLLPKDFLMMSRELDIYIERIPKHERSGAKKCMMEQLEGRGYK